MRGVTSHEKMIHDTTKQRAQSSIKYRDRVPPSRSRESSRFGEGSIHFSHSTFVEAERWQGCMSVPLFYLTFSTKCLSIADVACSKLSS